MIVSPLKDLQLMRRLECSWRDLQEIPEEHLEVWQAVMAGEEHSRRERAATTGK